MTQAAYQWAYDFDEKRFALTVSWEDQAHEFSFSWEDMARFAANMNAVVLAAQRLIAAQEKMQNGPLDGTKAIWEAPHEGAK